MVAELQAMLGKLAAMPLPLANKVLGNMPEVLKRVPKPKRSCTLDNTASCYQYVCRETTSLYRYQRLAPPGPYNILGKKAKTIRTSGCSLVTFSGGDLVLVREFLFPALGP